MLQPASGADQAGSGPDRRRRWRLACAVASAGAAILLVVAALLWLRGPVVALFRDHAALAAFLDRQGAWAPGVFMGLQALQVLLAPIPGHLLALAAGFLFGPWLGTLYTVVGVGVGSGIALIGARLWGRPLVRTLMGDTQLGRIDHWAARRGPLFFFLLFLIPFLPDDLACFAVGLSPLPALPMLGVIVLARLPGHFGSAWLGATTTHLPAFAWVVAIVLAVALLLLYWRHRMRLEGWLLQRLERTAAGRRVRAPSMENRS